jgi:hypothetical protein
MLKLNLILILIPVIISFKNGKIIKRGSLINQINQKVKYRSIICGGFAGKKCPPSMHCKPKRDADYGVCKPNRYNI